jgi:S-DNA-T family DNA segregation ATPase FtsK/SpoIIIE
MIKNYCKPFVKPTKRDDRNVVNRAKFNEYLETALGMGKLEKISQGIAATKYYISVNPISIKYLLGKKIERSFDAFFNTNNSRLYQDGKYVCLEVPNIHESILTFESGFDALQRLPSNSGINLYFGETLDAKAHIINLVDCVHLLVAGQTGSGKSIFLHNLILSLLLQFNSQEINMILIDPKQVEFGFYRGLSCVRDVIANAEKAARKIRELCDEMDSRYELFEKNNARDIESYNKNSEFKLPRIIIFIEEFYDLVTTSKDVTTSVHRLVSKARAAGIHVVLATQRPEAELLTGNLRSNFRGRVAFAVADIFNSRIVLGRKGAEKLKGKGDGLTQINSNIPIRFQSALITEEEVKAIVSEIKRNER